MTGDQKLSCRRIVKTHDVVFKLDPVNQTSWQEVEDLQTAVLERDKHILPRIAKPYAAGLGLAHQVELSHCSEGDQVNNDYRILIISYCYQIVLSVQTEKQRCLFQQHWVQKS